jgi:N-glycosylase/DNA lyase
MAQKNQINTAISLQTSSNLKEKIEVSSRQNSTNSICEEYLKRSNDIERFKIQDSNSEMEFKWGNPFVFGTPSYWVVQYNIFSWGNSSPSYGLGENLFEETLACLLGGYGIPAEMGLRAFQELKLQGLTILKSKHKEKDFHRILSKPIQMGNKTVRYRFATQKAQRIASAKQYFLNQLYFPETPKELRNWLLQIPGIGLKTASWIVRNQTLSNEVAIIDIHIQRAGIEAGFFKSNWTPAKNYLNMEEAFLAYSKLGKVAASGLDALIWHQMRVRRPHITG